MEQIHEACVGGIIENGACTACGVVIDEAATVTTPAPVEEVPVEEEVIAPEGEVTSPTE